MQLFRELGLSSAIFLVVGNIVGIGIFTTSGLIAEEVGFAMSRSWGNRVPRWESKIAPIKASSPPTIHAFKRCQAG